MHRGLHTEIQRIALLSLFLLVFGYLNDYLLLTLLCGGGIYMLWTFSRITKLYEWLDDGCKGLPTEATGVWGDMSDYLYRMQQRNERAKQSRKNLSDRVRNITSALADGTLTLTADRVLEWWNPAAEKLLGLAKTDRGQSIINLVRDPRFVTFIQSESLSPPLELPSPEDPTKILLFSAAEFGEGDIILVVQDITRLRNLEQMRQDFVANISHELRTPISLISGPLSQLLKKGTIDNADKSSLQKIYNNSKNLLNLVNEILDLSKLETDKLELDPQPTLIPQYFERLSAQFDSTAAIKSIDYQFISLLDEELTIIVDRGKMEKVINNLLSNAFKFTSKNGQIQMSLTRIEEELWVKVKDSGRGIPSEDIPYIFNRYYQSKSNTTLEGGTGIGLALTKELTELMGGQIIVHSTVGNGTTFELKIPMEVVSSAFRDINYQATVASSPVSVANSIISQEKKTILVVEDNLSLQEFIHSILLPYYNVIVVNNGLEALQQLTTGTPQLILSDVMMPEMDGFTLLEKVKGHDQFCSIPFILLTARADIQDKLHGLRIGVDDYMIKPFDPEELLLRIKNLITNARSRNVIEPILMKEISGTSIEGSTPNVTEKESTEVTNIDLRFLEKVEAIAKREVSNRFFSIENMAGELYVSKRQLSRKIKKTTGLTPNKYLREVRLHQAKRILETKEIFTVSEVAIAVGFENPTYFARIFEERFGKNIKEYMV